MNTYRYVIIGGGMAAGYAVKELVKAGLQPEELCLISADNVAPYNRPPLSKEFLEGKKEAEKLFINKPSFYEESGISLRLQCTATGLDTEAKRVTLDSGETIGYEKLLLATGSDVRHLDLPGSDQDGILYLRSFDSCSLLKTRAEQAKRLVVIGGGFIGTECASRLALQGLETTILFREAHLLDFFLPPEISNLYESRFNEHGVKLVPQAQITRFTGSDMVEGVQLASGEVIPADLVLVAVGVTPAVELARQAGLAVNKGVVVNEYLETSAPDVYAAGDVCEYPDRYLGQSRHVEHEDHARNSGKHAAKAMLGDCQPYDYLALVWSDVYDISWEFYGDSRGATQVIFRGDVPSAKFSAFWLQDGRLIGAMVYYDWTKTEGALVQEWIKQGTHPDITVLEDVSVPLA